MNDRIQNLLNQMAGIENALHGKDFNRDAAL